MPREDNLTVFERMFGVTDPDYDPDDIDPELERLNKADFDWKQMMEDRIRRN
jgi:hypothetical protein